MLLMYQVSLQNVETELMFTENVFHLFSTKTGNFAMHYPPVTTALFHFLLVSVGTDSS